jgi:hypothetical protein
VNPFGVGPSISNLSLPRFLILNECISFAFIGVNVSDEADALYLAIEVEMIFKCLLIRLIVESANEYGLLGIAFDILVTFRIVLLDLFLLLCIMVNHLYSFDLSEGLLFSLGFWFIIIFKSFKCICFQVNQGLVAFGLIVLGDDTIGRWDVAERWPCSEEVAEIAWDSNIGIVV